MILQILFGAAGIAVGCLFMLPLWIHTFWEGKR